MTKPQFNPEVRAELLKVWNLPLPLIEDLEANVIHTHRSDAGFYKPLTAKEENQELRNLQTAVKSSIYKLQNIHPDVEHSLGWGYRSNLDVHKVCESLQRIDEALNKIAKKHGKRGPQNIDILEPMVCLIADILLRHGQTVEDKTSPLFVYVLHVVFRANEVNYLTAQKAAEKFWPRIQMVKNHLHQQDEPD